MKKEMLKIVSTLGVAAMLVSALPQSALAAEIAEVTNDADLVQVSDTDLSGAFEDDFSEADESDVLFVGDGVLADDETSEGQIVADEQSEEGTIDEFAGEDEINGFMDPTITKAIQAEVNKALAHASNATTDLEKVLMLHDYLVLNTHPANPGENGSGAYQCLVEHKAVCSGYVAGFLQLLKAAGIEYKQVSRSTGSYYTSHTWVMVKVDGQWYHVDPTNDDSGDVLNHKWFMRSDSAMKDKGASWSANAPKASDTSYDNAFWTKTQGEIIKKGNDFYYAEVDKVNGWYGIIKKKTGKIENDVTGKTDTVIMETDDSVYESGDKIIQDTNGAIIVSDDSKAYVYKVKEEKKEPTPNISPSEEVKDVVIDGKKVIAEVVDKSTGKKRSVEIFVDDTMPDNPTPSNGFPFKDVTVKPGNWKYDSILFVYQNGYMKGVSDASFEPDKVLTRAQFAQVLYNIEAGTTKGLHVTYSHIFSDVPAGKWYSDAITWAAQSKIVNGYANGKFGVNDKITREQMVVMMMNYAKLKGRDTSQRASLSKFPDKSSVSSWAKDAFAWAVSEKIISGKAISGTTYLKPKSDATRAECATIIKNFMK